MIEIPENIVVEVLRQQAAMDWPEKVPEYVEFPDAGTVAQYHHYHDLTVGMCEQATAYHSKTAIALLGAKGSSGLVAETIARHILIARICRCRYIQLTNQEGSTEDDMPFAHNRW